MEITSLRTVHESTELYDEESLIDIGEGDLLGNMESVSECPELPNQFTSSEWSQNSIHLDPGQVVLFPLAIFPRFPIHSNESPTTLSYFARADHSQIGNYVQSSRYSTIQEHHQQQQQLVSATVELETSRGIVQMPLTVVTQRQNRYGLVDAVYFQRYDNDDIAAALRDIQNSKHNTEVVEEPPVPYIHYFRNAEEDSIVPDIRSDHECYDIYVNGLSQQSYDITAVRLVHSKSLRLYIAVGQETAGRSLRATEVGKSRISHWEMDDDDSLVFPHDGSLTIPIVPEDTEQDPRHYVVSVCRTQLGDTIEEFTDEGDDLDDWIAPNESDDSLGFLVLETSNGPLTVSLEQSYTKPRISISTDHVYNDTIPNNNQYIQWDDAPLINVTIFETAVPHATVDFYGTILSNDIKIMRASVIMKPIDDGILVELDHVPMEPLQAGTQIKINVTTHLDWNTLREKLSDDELAWKIQGALILHVTPNTKLTYTQWLDRLHPISYATDQIMEIPIAIHLCRSAHLVVTVQKTSHPVPTFWNLRVYNHATQIVDAAFFPAYPEITQRAVPPYLQPKVEETHIVGADHRLRIYTNRMDGLQIDHLYIRGDSFDDGSDPLHCNKVFIANIMESTARDRERDFRPYFNVGQFLIHYRFPRTMIPLHDLPIHPRVCTLTFETKPRTGPHTLLLLVYSGRLAVDTQDPPRNYISNPAEALEHYESTTDSSLTGFDNVLEWFRHSKSGYALRSLIKSVATKDSDVLRRYLQNLSKSIAADERHQTIVNPILLNAGAVAQGETETIPIFLTNYNPVPITVSIDVGEVEGFSIELGVDDSFRTLESPSLYDLLGRLRTDETARASVGRFKGQSVEAIRNFLRADKLAAKFFERFPFRDDITTSADAINSYGPVRRQYQEYAASTYSKKARSSRFSDGAWNDCNTSVRPPEYGPFQRKLKLDSRKIPGPLLISSDRRMQRVLNVCWFANGEPDHVQSDRRNIRIPPMGKARFDVTIRAPSSSVLEKDITSFLATGLSLSTDHGEVIPILMNFEALRGKFEFSHIPSIGALNTDLVDQTIQVPAGLFGVETFGGSEFVRIPPHQANSLSRLKTGATIVPRNVSTVESGVSLYVKSSFHRDIQLREVLSCNPWFKVSLANQSLSSTTEDPLLGIHIGAVSNIVSCDGVDGLPETKTHHPSFYRCALSWITKRLLLQPKGCGSIDSRDGRRSYVDSAREHDMGELISAVKRALVVTEWLDSLSRTTVYHGNATNASETIRSSEGMVGPLLAKTISMARKELTRASESGLLSLGTALRAVVQYNSTPDESAPISRESRVGYETNRLISLAIRNLTISSFLEIPTLLPPSDSSDRQAISFPPTHVFDTSSLMVSLRNPTAVPVRVRIGTAPSFNDAVDRRTFGSSHKMPYVHGYRGNISKPQDFASLQWWENGGSYYFPDPLGDSIRSHDNFTLKYESGARISMVNPSFFSSSAFLLGCGARCGLRTPNNHNRRKEALVDLTPSSPIGASAAGGVLLRGYFGAESSFKVNHKQHPLKLHAGGSLYTNLHGPANFALSRSALDEIIIPPFSEAELGPLLFHPSGRTRRIGCGAIRGNRKVEDCSSQLFETTVYLENSLSGVEELTLRGRALWESIIFLDPTENEFGHIELRYGEPTVLFSGSALESRDYLYPIPEIVSVVVHNDGDSSVIVTSGGFLDGNSKLDHATSCKVGTFELIDCAETFPFTLQPNQNRTLSVVQLASCLELKEYQRLVLNFERFDSAEYSSKFRGDSFRANQDTFQQSEKLYKKQIDIVVGYEIQTTVLSKCINSFRYPLESKNERANGRSNRVWRRRFPVLRVIVLVLCILFLVDKLLNSWERVIMFNVALERYVKNLTKAELRDTGWSCSYSLLSHNDEITSTELQVMSTERNATILQSTSKKLGISSRAYSLARNNTVSVKAPASKATSDRRGHATSDRVRASEGMFGRFNPEVDVSPGKLPVNIGWRIAASRGYIDAGTFAAGSIKLKTAKLMEDRRIAEENKRGKLNGAVSPDNSSIATSYGELSIEEEIDNGRSARNVPKVVTNGRKGPKDHPEPVSPTVSESGWVDARTKPPKPPQNEAPSPTQPSSSKKTEPAKQRSTKQNTIKKEIRKEQKQQSPPLSDPAATFPTLLESIPVPVAVEPDQDSIPDTEEESDRTATPPSPTTFRPPPGLAPPPGFGSAPMSLPTEAPPGESPQLLPSFAPELPSSSFSLDNNNASPNHQSSALEGIIPGLAADQPAIEYDFNVMDFLDGLLEENQRTSVPSNPWAAGDDALFGGDDIPLNHSNNNDTTSF